MEIKLIIIVLVLQVITVTTGHVLMKIYKEDFTPKLKRSPANGFPSFGLRLSLPIPNLFSRDRQPISVINQLFTPIRHQHRNEEEFHKPIQKYDVMKENNKAENYGLPKNSLEIRNLNMYRNTDSSHVAVLGNYEIKVNQRDNSDNTFNEQYTSIFPSIKLKEVDQGGIKPIFNNENDLDSITTTEDTAMDSTTGTNDFESTTTDDLLQRIPPAAVATLLGR